MSNASTRPRRTTRCDYSGQPVDWVQEQLSAGARVIGPFGSTAMNPTSKSGPPPVSATPAATATEQALSGVHELASYGCGIAGGEPSVNGPFRLKFVKPAPARAQPSPFRSAKLPVAPAVVNSAFRTSCVTSSSPSSNVDPRSQSPGALCESCQVVDSDGTASR